MYYFLDSLRLLIFENMIGETEFGVLVILFGISLNKMASKSNTKHMKNFFWEKKGSWPSLSHGQMKLDIYIGKNSIVSVKLLKVMHKLVTIGDDTAPNFGFDNCSYLWCWTLFYREYNSFSGIRMSWSHYHRFVDRESTL